MSFAYIYLLLYLWFIDEDHYDLNQCSFMDHNLE